MRRVFIMTIVLALAWPVFVMTESRALAASNCPAAMVRCVGNLASAAAKCFAKEQVVPKVDICVSKVKVKFSACAVKAESKVGCATPPTTLVPKWEGEGLGLYGKLIGQLRNHMDPEVPGAVYMDEVDGTMGDGYDPSKNGCHYRYTKTFCAADDDTRVLFAVDSCKDELNLIEWTDGICHLPIDLTLVNCPSYCSGLGFNVGHCGLDEVSKCGENNLIGAKCYCSSL
jgi:hypothetical protein